MDAYDFILRMKDYATSGIRSIASSVGMLDSNISKSGGSSDMLSGKLVRLVGVVGSLILTWQAFNFVGSLFNKGVELEQTRIKFEVLLGSVEKGNNLLKQLNEFADFTPYSNKGIQKGAEVMLGFGIANEKVMGNIKMLGDVAMGSEEKLGGLSLVYSQIMATGRLMGQDLLQLINQGFNPLQVISDNTGISMDVLKKKMEEGSISASMIEEAFRLATSEGGRYYGMTDKMAESAGGKWSTLIGNLQQVLSKVGLAFAEWVSPMIDIGISVVNNIIPFFQWLSAIYRNIAANKPLLIFLSSIITALGINFIITNAAAIGWAVTLGILEGMIWLVNAATAAWNFVLSLNPIGLIIIAIGALVAVVVYLWQKFDWFRGSVMGVWSVLKGFADMIKNYVVTRIKELISSITGVGESLVLLFKGDFSGAAEAGKKAIRDLVGVDSKTQLLKDGYEAFKSFGTGYEQGAKEFVKKDIAKVNTPEQVFSKQNQSSVFNDLLTDKKDKDSKAGSNSKNSTSDSITSGGSKMTQITVNFQKLHDDVIINVNSLDQAVKDFPKLIREELLRTVNSINQMQTG